MADDADLDLALRAFGRGTRGARIRAAVSLACPGDEDLRRLREVDPPADENALSVARHVLGCPRCAHRLSRSGDIGEVSAHPSTALLMCYAEKRLPAHAAGRAVYEQIRLHVASCASCEQQAQAMGTRALAATPAHTAANLPTSLQKTLARSIAAIARMQQAANEWVASLQPAMAQTRRGGGDSVEAFMLNSKGEVAFVESGQIARAVFAVTKARVAPEHGLTIDLITTDQRLVGQPNPPLVEITLMTPTASLRLPPQHLKSARSTPYPAARVSLRHPFDVSVATAIPASALCVTVTCIDQSGKEQS